MPITGCYLNRKHKIMRIEKPMKHSEKSSEVITYQPSKLLSTFIGNCLRISIFCDIYN
nr:unnamed protein product [Callosobruchus chinensis]